MQNRNNANATDRFDVDVSVIVPVLNEENNVGQLLDELIAVLEGLKRTYEVITINMPGRDKSFEVMKDRGSKYEHVYPINVVYLQTKGYQKGYQYMLGFKNARGKWVVQMDSDYQDDPHDLPKFLEKLEEGYDLVVGWKQDRKDPFLYKLTSLLQNTLTRLITKSNLHDKNCGYKAYSRSAVDSVHLYGMNYRDIPMQLAAKGFNITELPIANRKRISGQSNFTFINRLIGGTIDFLSTLLMSMMLDKPFRVWGGLGLVVGGAGVLAEFMFMVWLILYQGNYHFNWWIVIWVLLAAVCMLMGSVLFAVGVITEYMRSLRTFSMSEYHIIDDPKGLLSRN